MSLSISVSFGLLTIWKFDRKLAKCAKSTVLLANFVVLSNGSSDFYFNLNFFLLTFLKIQSSWDVAVRCHCLLSHILLPSISHKSLKDKEDTYYTTILIVLSYTHLFFSPVTINCVTHRNLCVGHLVSSGGRNTSTFHFSRFQFSKISLAFLSAPEMFIHSVRSCWIIVFVLGCTFQAKCRLYLVEKQIVLCVQCLITPNRDVGSC